MATQAALGLLEAVFEHATDGIIIVDADRRIRAMNAAARRLTGCDMDSAAGFVRCVDCLQCKNSAGKPMDSASCPCLQALAQGQPNPNFPLLVKDAATADYVPMSVSASVLPLDGGNLLAIVLRDDSERQRVLRERELLYQVARSLASVADFAEGVRRALATACELTGAEAAAWAERDSQSGEWRVHAIHGSLPEAGTQRFFPLEGHEGSLGTLLVAAREPLQPGSYALLGAIAAHMATAVENARLNERVRTQAVAAERQRLAGEMHDSLAQTLAIISRQARDLNAHLQGESSPVQPMAGMLVRAVDQAHREVRAALFDLRTPLSGGGDFVASLEEYLEEFGLQHRLEVSLDADPPEPLHLPLEVEAQVLRIIQEALTNVRRHAHAHRATVVLQRRAPNLLTVRVSDDGTGFDMARLGKGAGHYGLQVMQERAKHVGGLLTVQSKPGAGTVVELELPLGGKT